MNIDDIWWKFLILISFYQFSNSLCVTVTANEYQLNLEWQKNIWRQEQLESVCGSLGLNSKPPPKLSQLDHLLVDHKHRLLYCYVPKVACTNWKRLLMVLSGRWNDSNIMTIPGSTAHAAGSVTRLSELPEEVAKKCLKEYTRFIFVRHPFERLLSAYRNKLEDHRYPSARYFQARVGRYIIKNYRINASEMALKNGDDVTFYEFTSYLLAERNETQANNEHWRPIVQMCYPCSIGYHVIGKYESLIEDSEMILNMVNASYLSFPSTKSANTSNRLFEYFKQIPLKITEKLYHLYELDFKLFGYTLENILGFEFG